MLPRRLTKGSRPKRRPCEAQIEIHTSGWIFRGANAKTGGCKILLWIKVDKLGNVILDIYIYINTAWYTHIYIYPYQFIFICTNMKYIYICLFMDEVHHYFTNPRIPKIACSNSGEDSLALLNQRHSMKTGPCGCDSKQGGGPNSLEMLHF